MKAIPYIEKGQAITAEWLNLLVRAINALLGLAIVPAWFGRVLISDANAKIVLDPTQIGSGGSGTAAAGCWAITRSTYSGSGTPPTDQARRVRVGLGLFAGRLPSNRDSELTVPDDEGWYAVCVKGETSTGGTPDETGKILTCLLDVLTVIGDALPEDPAGSMGHAPAYFHHPLGLVRIEDEEIAEIVQLETSPLSVQAVVVDVGCGVVTKAFLVG